MFGGVLDMRERGARDGGAFCLVAWKTSLCDVEQASFVANFFHQTNNSTGFDDVGLGFMSGAHTFTLL